MSILLETSLPLPLFRRGKVRDAYDFGDRLLIVSTDRISAFDVVLPCGIPDKGKVLNQLSAFWFEKTKHIIPNHFIKIVDSDVIARAESPKQSQGETDSSLTLGTDVVGRSMIVVKAERISVECIVRGYLTGSAWAEYKHTGKVGDIDLPSNMRESEEFPQPIFTPTTKSDVEHDRPLTPQDIRDLGVEDLISDLEEKSLLIYTYARNYAKAKGIIIADTKFEFGLIDGKLALIDELLTPDSSRFWDASQYNVGVSQDSFDKQPVRDWLVASGWDKEPPAPMLPQEIIEGTTKRYREVYSRLTEEII
ncbi:MAG: phosphoribosylaminoimidazolesuccinocarboxamide synthase [Chloroflexota bacterium]|nr:phosphoribosylaminoimidazolesuccinocarboxamide synthase [Chloroflexota bacterium]